MFQGAAALNLDAKGRLAIPARHRDALAVENGQVVLTAHPHGCLLVYPVPAWVPIRDKVLAAPGLDPTSAMLKRLLVGFAQEEALDAAGRFLMSASLDGRVLWSTPQANRLIGTHLQTVAGEGYLLPEAVRTWLAAMRAGPAAGGADTINLTDAEGTARLSFSYVGQVGPQELLLRVAEVERVSSEDVLRRAFGLTSREAEVLGWIAHGKPNRDIAEILGLSPRTVNKHLEQIYAKIGVENRASAAAAAVRALSAR